MEFDKSKPFQADPVLAGERIYTLTKVKDCTQNKLSKTSQGWLRTDEQIPALRFVFKDNNRKSWLCHTVNKGVSDKSGLFKFLQRCYNSLLSKEVKFRTDGSYSCCEPENRLISLAQQLTGMQFRINVVYGPKDPDCKYPKIGEIEPIGDIRTEAVVHADFLQKVDIAQDAQENIPFGHDLAEDLAETPAPQVKDDDDIPW